MAETDPWWSPTSTAKGSLVLFLQHTSIHFHIDGRPYMFFTGLIHCSDTPCLACTNTVLPQELWRSFPPRSMNTQCKSCCPSLYLSFSCLIAKITPVVDFPFTNPNCSSHYAHDASQSILVHVHYHSHIGEDIICFYTV